ncbi:hypothetical protein [Croceivirga thetidis]|uniref:DUF3299 domain-containing protein n=1 Tax=Croceivirga thetidis TaxID=2721623 RepID=A0ABX1GRH6_9FLAO|nr:hypothetical protein [Croceivirga thetidis]NKI32179.1 hypothetical protein [Croceivirga thetidis]
MRILFSLFIFFSLTGFYAQTTVTWSDLQYGISWKESTSELVYPGFLEADFSNELTHLKGKEITLTGYLLVLDGSQEVFILSKSPMASCFFCGNEGPETISEISFAKDYNFMMDDLITVTGILRLNRDDPTRCYYRIENAEGFGL